MSIVEKIKSKLDPLIASIKARISNRQQAEGNPKITVSEALANAGQSSSISLVRTKVIARPALEWTYVYVLLGLLGFMAADLTILSIRDLMLPTSAPPARPNPPAPMLTKMRNQYNVVTTRNIFNSDGVIPPPLSQPKGQNNNLDGPAVPSTLPLNLIGTIVHKNPGKSMASIEVKTGTPKILPFVVNDDIEGMATLLRVDRKRAVFRNNQTGRNEFIEIKDKSAISFGMKAVDKPAVADSGPGQLDFTLPRNEVNNYIKNLPELLQQARAEPNILPGGKIDGFRIMDIMPGSIYEKLGIKKDDIIKGVNGEAVDSPAKAMELYQTLRNSNRISIEVERNGSKETMNYNIN